MPLQVPSRAQNANTSRVASSVTTVTVAAAFTARTGLLLYNDSTANCFVKFGAAASSTDFVIKLSASSYYEMPQPIFNGLVTAVWDAANGALQVTELF
jgi:hypothetical protein